MWHIQIFIMYIIYLCNINNIPNGQKIPVTCLKKKKKRIRRNTFLSSHFLTLPYWCSDPPTGSLQRASRLIGTSVILCRLRRTRAENKLRASRQWSRRVARAQIVGARVSMSPSYYNNIVYSYAIFENKNS